MISTITKIVVTNQKGGDEDTPLDQCYRGTAAAEYGALLIGLDPQGYLADGVGLESEYTTKSTTLYDALQYPM